MDDNLETLFKITNYKLQINDYEKTHNSKIWSKFVNNLFNNLDINLLKNFF